VRVGEWLECWCDVRYPQHGRVIGIVTGVATKRSSYIVGARGFRSRKDSRSTLCDSFIMNAFQKGSLDINVPSGYFTSEIIRRLTVSEIMLAKLQGIGVGINAKDD